MPRGPIPRVTERPTRDWDQYNGGFRAAPESLDPQRPRPFTNSCITLSPLGALNPPLIGTAFQGYTAPQFELAGEFREGLAPVMVKGLWGGRFGCSGIVRNEVDLHRQAGKKGLGLSR